MKIHLFVKNCKLVAWPSYYCKRLNECMVMVDISQTIFVPGDL